MSSIVVRSQQMPFVRSFLWRHPEWWTLALGAAGWVYLLLPTRHHHGHEAGLSRLLHWAAMIIAMMFPLLIGHLRVVANRSLWRRRHRAMALYLAGYAAPWLVYGALVMPVVATVPFATSLGLGVAAVWQLTPWKRLGLLACHRTEPLAPLGWRADQDCLRYGWNSARHCLLSCWALMLSCASSHDVIWLMPTLTAFTWVERVANRPRQQRFSFVLLLLAWIFHKP